MQAVIPVATGIQGIRSGTPWMPAFAGMTKWAGPARSCAAS